MELRPYQQAARDGAHEQWKTHRSTIIVMATGLGKCLGRDTPVLMFDGSIRPVQDIRIGDLLMGPDSQAREVLSTVAGVGELFRVVPTKGEPYVVNGPHLLSVKMTTSNKSNDGAIINIEAQKFNQKSKTFRHRAKGYRVPIQWPERGGLMLDPYFLGLWLGDGSSKCPAVTTADSEIIEYLHALGAKNHLRCVTHSKPDNKAVTVALSGPPTGISKIKANPIREGLFFYGLLNNKHVPYEFKQNSIAVRAEVLAGLMDSDGYRTEGGYEYVSKLKRLAEDVAFLARSIGLAAYISECRKECCNNHVWGTYWRVGISGDCSALPLKVVRKATPNIRRQKKDVLVTGIRVEPYSCGEYYGFEITGDKRFLLGDFTVTHNSSTLAFIIKDFQPKRAIVIAHRRELIWQLKEEIEQVTGLTVAIEMGDVFSDETLFEKAQVVVATVQTLSRRLAKFRPDEFGLLVYDEAHHSVAPVNRKVVDHFLANPELKLLFTTATPERADEEALNQVCESTAFDYGIFEGVKDGWLVDITAQFCNVKHLDLSKVHTTAGDLNQGELAKIMERDEIVMGVAQPIVEVSYGLKEHTLDDTPPDKWSEYLATLQQAPRRGIVFTVTVDQAEGLATLLRMAHPKLAEAVSAQTPPEDRTQIFGRFKSGETSLICNVGICTEGYNNPRVQTIFIARPTKSRSLYMQMIGRSTRTLPGTVDGLETAEERRAAIAASAKPWARLVDFSGNTGRHDLVSPWNILGGNVSDSTVERAIRKAKNDGKPVRIIANLNNTANELKAEAKKAQEDARGRVLARSKFHMGEVDLMGGGHKPTLWQSSNIGPSASEKQIKVLARAGVHPDWWQRKNYGWIRAKLADNGWRLPTDMDFLKHPKIRKAA